MCQCFIVPIEVLERLSKDTQLSPDEREHFAKMVDYEAEWRKARALVSPTAVLAQQSFSARVPLAASPAVTVYDCKHNTTLPGSPVPNPGASVDPTHKAVFNETTALATFYSQVFGRNSIDGLGMTMQSSVHYGVKYNNAFWNGQQMTYGDGDGNIFLDFSKGNDVIGHELTHGVTQYTLQLAYANEAGGLNESISDVFGSMFRQWQGKQNVNHADWLIGKDIMGPAAKARGFTCLRDMANPKAAHCLAPQIDHFSQYQNGMDPHFSSGVPNFAFYKAAMQIGGNSWSVIGQVWYHTLVQLGAKPTLKMKAFADKTRAVAKADHPSTPSVAKAVDAAWKAVGL